MANRERRVVVSSVGGGKGVSKAANLAWPERSSVMHCQHDAKSQELEYLVDYITRVLGRPT